MTEVRVPQLNNTDETVVVVGFLAEDGTTVTAGAAIVEVETSKATHELEAPVAGTLRFAVQVGREVPVGSVLAVIDGEPAVRNEAPGSVPAGRAGAADPAAQDSAPPTLTNAARALATEHAIPATRIAALGKRVVRAVDLEPLLRERSTNAVELTRRQQAIAKIVTRSNAEIPAGFCVVAVSLAAYDEVLGAGGEIGLPEAVVKAVAHLFQDFPAFYGSLVGNSALELPAMPVVGFTVDVGNGLVIPAVTDPRAHSVDDLADAMMELRLRALDETLREEELVGNISVSVNHEEGVVFVQPLVFPGQAAMVSIGGRQAGPDGETSVYLGLAYDHRIVSGRDAILFGQRLRGLLESVETLRTWRG